MGSNRRILEGGTSSFSTFPRAGASLAFMLALSSAQAQELALPTGAASGPPAFIPQSPDESPTSALGLPGYAASVEQLAEFFENPLQWGPFSGHPHVTDSFTYGDGLHSRPGQSALTALNRLSPGLTIVSRHLIFDYTPRLDYYIKGPYEDTVNHFAFVAANFGYGDWHFSIAQHYAKTFVPLIETSRQTETELFSTSLSAFYRYTEKISFQLTANQLFHEASGVTLNNYRQWITMNWIDYLFTTATSAGLGVGGGYVNVENGTDMSFEQFQGRIAWHPGRKLSVSASGGIELRQFLSEPETERLNPLMNASIGYKLSESTFLSFVANHRVTTSIFENQVTESTALVASVHQRLLEHLRLTVSGGYRFSDYQGTTSLTSPSRADTHTFVLTSLGTHFLKKGTASVSYLHGVNESNVPGFSSTTDQYTATVGYRF